MYTMQVHPLAADELARLPDDIRGYAFRLLERLGEEGQVKMPHGQPVGADMFEMFLGKGAWSLFGYVEGESIYLLQVFSKDEKPTPAKARKLARERARDF